MTWKSASSKQDWTEAAMFVCRSVSASPGARAYYDAHKDRYAAQQRVKIWQIVVDKKEEADAMTTATTVSISRLV